MLFREEWIGNFRFIEYKDYVVERPSTMFVALPDSGLVGVIAASYMASKLGFDEVGGVDSPYLPPIVIVHKAMPKPPIRIFASGRVAIVYTEVTLSPEIQLQFISSLIDYARLKGTDTVIGFTGLPIHNRLDVSDLRTYYVSSMGSMDVIEKSGAKALERGLLVGPFATLLKECMRKKVMALVFLTESFMEFPDPEAAAKGLQILSKVIGIEIDTAGLFEQAEMIKLRARELMRNTMNMMSSMRKEMEYGAPLHM